MKITRVKVDEITFKKVYDNCYKIKALDTETFTKLLTVGRTNYNNENHIDRKVSLFCEETQSLICRTIDLYDLIATQKEINECNDIYKDLLLVMDKSKTEELKSVDEIPDPLTGRKATAYVLQALSKYYTEEEIEECLNAHEFEPIGPEDKELHQWIPANYKVGTVYQVNNCVKYDINGAYCYFLTKIFPKAASVFKGIRRSATKYKNAGNKAKAQFYKDIPNYYVGNLINTGHKKTRAWIVKQVRLLMDKTINDIGGELIYANTDGFIIHNPDYVFDTNSKTLGEFKYELYNHINCVYLYLNDLGHNYQLIQWRDTNNNIKSTGTIPLEMRQYCNLETSTVVDYTEAKDANGLKIYKLKEIVDGKKTEII